MNDVYTDIFEHAFDAKGRVIVPAEWRTSGHADQLHVLPSSEGCLKVYPSSWLKERLEALKSAPLNDPRRKQLEVLAGIAQTATVDRENGRTLIKPRLREHAQIKREAVLEGCLDHFKIWAAEVWKKRPERAALTMEELLQQAGL